MLPGALPRMGTAIGCSGTGRTGMDSLAASGRMTRHSPLLPRMLLRRRRAGEDPQSPHHRRPPPHPTTALANLKLLADTLKGSYSGMDLRSGRLVRRAWWSLASPGLSSVASGRDLGMRSAG